MNAVGHQRLVPWLVGACGVTGAALLVFLAGVGRHVSWNDVPVAPEQASHAARAEKRLRARDSRGGAERNVIALCANRRRVTRRHRWKHDEQRGQTGEGRGGGREHLGQVGSLESAHARTAELALRGEKDPVRTTEPGSSGSQARAPDRGRPSTAETILPARATAAGRVIPSGSCTPGFRIFRR